MLTGLDPHSAYLDQEAFRELQVGTQGEFGGLGIEVGMEDGFVKVVSPIDDTPASRAGIKPGDLIVKLDDTSVKGMSLNDAVKRMRGKPNTQITLTIVRKGEPKPIVVTLTRASSRSRASSQAARAGLRLRARQPVPGAHRRDPRRAVEKLFKQNQGPMKGLVLDLRNDPGGLLNGAVAVSAAFLPQNALVVYTDGRTEDAKMKLNASPEHYLRGRARRTTCRSCRPAVKTCRWWCWSTAARRRPRRSSPARCRTTSAR
jgi:carboxyl-terminal processing protease